MDIKTLCLGALSLGDATGYDIKKIFDEAFSHFFAAGYGSIYPALEKLAEEGKVEYGRQQQEKRPDKKVFRITAAGRETFIAELIHTAPREKLRSEFLVQMFFAHKLPPQRLAEVLQERLDESQRELVTLEDLAAREMPAGMKFTIHYGLAITHAAIACIKEHQECLVRDARTIVRQCHQPKPQEIGHV